MRVGARRYRHAQLRRAVAESEIALWRAQQNHGTRQQKLLGCRFHGALKRDRVEWLEGCWCRRPHHADRAHCENRNTQYFACHYLTSLKLRRETSVRAAQIADSSKAQMIALSPLQEIGEKPGKAPG